MNQDAKAEDSAFYGSPPCNVLIPCMERLQCTILTAFCHLPNIEIFAKKAVFQTFYPRKL